MSEYFTFYSNNFYSFSSTSIFQSEFLREENGEIVLEELKAIIYFNFTPFVIPGVMYINFDSLPVNFNILCIRNCSLRMSIYVLNVLKFLSRLFATYQFCQLLTKTFQIDFFLGLTVATPLQKR